MALAVRRWRWLSGRLAGVADAVAAVGRRALIAAGGGAKLSRGQLAQLRGGAGDGRTMTTMYVHVVWPVCRVSGLGADRTSMDCRDTKRLRSILIVWCAGLRECPKGHQPLDTPGPYM